MIVDFVTGMTYIAKGWRAFYGNPKTWRFAIAPMLVMLVFYILAIVVVFYVSHVLSEKLTNIMQQLPSWLSWSSPLADGFLTIVSVLFVIILLSTTICALYEFFGSLFFDPLTEYHEKTKFNVQIRTMTLGECLKFAWDTVCWGFHTLIVFFFLFLLSLFLPIIGQMILIGGMGYCFGISYMICSANNNNISIKELRSICARRPALVLGFGCISYLLLSIPFVTLILLPALVLGGSELFNTQLKKEIS